MANHDYEKIIKPKLEQIKNHETVKKMFDEYGVDIEEIFLIPIAFKDLEVSARTDHAVIYINNNLKNKEFDHYLVHEITHFLQQTTGTKPTKGADDGDYLDNEFEQEGFQNQTEYMSDTRGDDVAEKYIEKVLDHHEVDEEDKEEKKDDLLSLANLFAKISGCND